MAGLTATGIEIKDVSEIVADLGAEQIANIDPLINLEPDDFLGQLNGIVGAAIAEAWELLEELYHSAYPDTASGQSLSYVSALTGTIRAPATKATIPALLVGTVSTVVPAGTECYVDGRAEHRWVTTAPATIAEEGAIDFVLVTMESTITGSGPYADFSGVGEDLIIATPVAGLTEILLQNDSTPGADEEDDDDLRLRREQSLALAGTSTVEAIRAEMLTVTGVDSCTVFENPTAVTDAKGLPPYSIEVLVHSITAPDFDSEDVVQQIWNSKPGGTETYGALNDDATDSQGNLHTINYSEPTTATLYAAVTLTAATDGTYIGNTNVEQAIVDWADKSLQVGQSVYASDIINVVADLEGVVSVDVGNVFVEEDDATPDQTEWIATPRALGEFILSRVTATS